MRVFASPRLAFTYLGFGSPPCLQKDMHCQTGRTEKPIHVNRPVHDCRYVLAPYFVRCTTAATWQLRFLDGLQSAAIVGGKLTLPRILPKNPGAGLSFSLSTCAAILCPQQESPGMGRHRSEVCLRHPAQCEVFDTSGSQQCNNFASQRYMTLNMLANVQASTLDTASTNAIKIAST